MYLMDYHSHTLISPDSTCPLLTLAQSGVDAGLSELCITDHCDLLDGHGQPDTHWDWAPSVAQMELVRPELKNQITLKLGLELGMPHLYPNVSAEICSNPNLDFVIGSIHNLSPSHGGGDFYFLTYPHLEDCYRALDDYFTSMTALVSCDHYDVLGHVIYPLRYMPKEVTLDRYIPQITEILKTVIANGRGIELNTYRGRSIEEWRPLLTLYHQLGGTIITVGADAHMADSVGLGIKEGYQLLQEVGFTHITAYEKRVPTQVPFSTL